MATYLLVLVADGVEPLEDLPGMLFLDVVVYDIHVFFVRLLHIQLMRFASTHINAQFTSFTICQIEGANTLVQASKISVLHPFVWIEFLVIRQFLWSNDTVGDRELGHS